MTIEQRLEQVEQQNQRIQRTNKVCGCNVMRNIQVLCEKCNRKLIFL